MCVSLLLLPVVGGGMMVEIASTNAILQTIILRPIYVSKGLSLGKG